LNDHTATYQKRLLESEAAIQETQENSIRLIVTLSLVCEIFTLIVGLFIYKQFNTYIAKNYQARKELKKAKLEAESGQEELRAREAHKEQLLNLNALLRKEYSTTECSEALTGFFSKLTKAHAVVFYIVDSEKKVLNFSGSYPQKISDTIPEQIRFGVGLCGQAAIDKRPLKITNQSDYLKISTTIGSASPENILIFPMIYEGNTFAVLEAGSFTEFSDSHLDFLKQANDTLVNSISLTLSRDKINDLLKQSRKQSQELEQHTKSLKNANITAEEARVEAVSASSAKGNFLANMSHEIRTPMNGVIGMIDMLLETHLNPDQLDFAESIKLSAESLLIIINDILDFSKIEAGKLDIEEIEFNLHFVLEKLSDLIALKASEKGLEFILFINNDVPDRLIGDPGRLRQILTNLSGNAVKFCGKGEVTITVSLKEETDSEAILLFEVSDTGIGIPKDRMNRLFKSFSQVDATTTREYGGTGLGLAISKQLVELMGGQIGVDSTEGRGSTFRFTIRTKKPLKDRPDTIEIPKEIKGARILIINDNFKSRQVLKEYLTSWDCQYDEVLTPEAAFHKLRETSNTDRQFKLVIVDIQTHISIAEKFGRQVMNSPEIKDIPLIIAVSSGQRGDSKKMREAGFSAYLTKPIRKTNLFDCIRSILGLESSGKQDSNHVSNEIITIHSIEENKISQKKGPAESYNILLAEDNKMNQKVILHMLGKMGHTITVANNGREAVTAFEKETFDFILMDGQMPVMSGIEATAEIRRKEEKGAHIPIIALTANSMKGDRERFLAEGMNGYVTKPIKKDALNETIHKCMEKQKKETVSVS
ncbi:response regulator, partial [bacterium]|nr:response regulator [bacterium]